MFYRYEVEKDYIFTYTGVKTLLRVRDNVIKILNNSSSVDMGNAILGIGGSSWMKMACVDFMVELGELVEITPPVEHASQNRVFDRGEKYPKYE